MKKLLLLFLLLQSYSQLSAQAYQPFPTDSAVWKIYGGDSNSSGYYNWNISGDTIINGKIYSKIFSGDFYYKGCLREDNKKILFIPRDSLTDKLLYDFNLIVGDTLKSYLMWPNCTAVIDTIDSVLIKNNWHKRFWAKSFQINCFQDVQIIEGIGSSFGLLSKYYRGLAYATLVCVKVNNQTIYVPETWYNCEGTDAINDQTFIPVKLYPNPITNYSVIDLSSVNGNFKKIEIYNSLGQVVKTASLKNVNEFLISKDDFKSGYYLYKLSNDRDFVTGKFVVE